MRSPVDEIRAMRERIFERVRDAHLYWHNSKNGTDLLVKMKRAGKPRRIIARLPINTVVSMKMAQELAVRYFELQRELTREEAGAYLLGLTLTDRLVGLPARASRSPSRQSAAQRPQ